MKDIGDIDLRSLGIAVLLNTSSGSCDDESERTLAAILDNAGLKPNQTQCVEGGRLDQAFTEIIDSDPDVLIVLGGDGTIRAAAERCGSKDIVLLPLPGGTMNMLPTALYGKCDWQSALSKTLDDPKLLRVSGAEVEGHRFFCAGIFGAPSLWAGPREAIRESRLMEAFHRALHAYHRTFSRNLEYQFDDQRPASATAVTVISALVSTALPDQRAALEAAALDVESAGEAFRLAANAVFSDWRVDESVLTQAVQQVRIRSNAPIPAILDGEGVHLQKEAKVCFIENTFTALVQGSSLRP